MSFDLIVWFLESGLFILQCFVNFKNHELCEKTSFPDVITLFVKPEISFPDVITSFTKPAREEDCKFCAG